MRRSYVSAHLEGGSDIATVRQLCGHSSPVTTSRYSGRGERSRDLAAENITTTYVAPSAS